MATTKNEANEANEANPEIDQIEALLASGDATRLAELAAGSDKNLSKLARRALHVLRTRGVNAPVVAKPKAAGPKPIRDSAEAWTCVPDANGERLVVVVVPVPGAGDFHVVTAHVSDERGLLQLAFGTGPRKHARDVRKSFEESGGFAADVPIERATELIEAAYQLTLARGQSPPPEFALARRVLPHVHLRADTPHPALAEIAPRELDRDAAELLHQLPTLARWIVGRAELRALEQQLEAVATSTLFVDQVQRQAAWQDTIDKAIVNAFAGAGRERWQRRLYDAAIVYQAAGHPEDAQALRAQGDRLMAADFAPLDDGFARGLVEKATQGIVLPPIPEPEAAAPGLIVAP